MGNIEEHIAEAARRAQQAEEDRVRDALAQAECARTRLRQCESEIRDYAKVIGDRQHNIFIGRRIRWFRADFSSCSSEWDIEHLSGSGSYDGGRTTSTEVFIFRGRKTDRYERVGGGLFFSEWDLSIPDALWDDIHDKRFLETSLNISASIVIMLRSKANKRMVSRILRKFFPEMGAQIADDRRRVSG